MLVVYDEADYVPLVQHALHAAEVPHDLTVVEDGHQAPASVVRDRRAGVAPRPDVLVLGLTHPTAASLRMAAEVRTGQPVGEVKVCGLSRSPDGAALLRGLGLGVGVWVTGFADLRPLSEALRTVYAGVVAGVTASPTGANE